jgi:hypothetical protein
MAPVIGARLTNPVAISLAIGDEIITSNRQDQSGQIGQCLTIGGNLRNVARAA